MIELRKASYTYRGADTPAVRDVTLRLEPGRTIAIVGRNGSGKSTLSRLMNGSILPSGGSVVVNGVDTSTPGASVECAREVGFVRQDPTDQLVSANVFDEVAFGPANLGWGREEVREAVSSSLRACGLEGYERRGVDELSGGERQRLALAGVIALRPSFLLLDEVTAQLDSIARDSVRRLVRSLAASGVGIVQVTHDLEEVLVADEVVVLEDGRLAWRGLPRDLILDERAFRLSGFADGGLRDVMAILASSGLDLALGLAPQRLVGFARERGVAREVAAACGTALARTRGRREHDNLCDQGQAAGRHGVGLSLREATQSYEGTKALDDVSADVPRGEVTLVAGLSGSGKSTMAKALSGVLELDSGSASLDGKPVRAGMVGLGFQRPQDQLFAETVLDDVSFGPRNLGHDEETVRSMAEDALGRLDVERGLWGRSPLALSGGQARRVALAGIIAAGPRAYVFDEPTAGLDADGRAFVRRLVSWLAVQGASVLVVSHDEGEWLDLADRAVLLRAGHVVWEGPAASLVADPRPFGLAGLRAPLLVGISSLLDGEARRDG